MEQDDWRWLLDYLDAIQQTNDGGYILGGTSVSDISGDKTDTSRGYFDYWIVKLDSAGNIQWDKTFGGNHQDNLTCLQQTSDGGYILGGLSNSKISGDKTEGVRGYNDYWIVKTDSQGNKQWDKSLGGNAEDDLFSLQQTNDGGYILGGYSNSKTSGDKTQNSKGLSDYWVVKLTGKGHIQWGKTIGGNSNDYLRSIKQTKDGGYIAGGYSNSNSSGSKTENSKGGFDYWVVKLNGLGHIQWDKTIGGKKDDKLFSIQQTRDDGYILGGYSVSGISGDKTEISRGREDYWTVKLDKKGTLEWDKTIGGETSDYMKVIKENKKNQYILGGYSYSLVSGDKTKNSKGGIDYWIVYLEYTPPGNNSNKIAFLNKVSLQNAIIANKSFNTYPNPVKDILHVQSKSKTIFSLTDQSGKTILTKTIESNGEINVTDLTPGLYYLKNNETGVSQKVVVVK